MILELNYHEYYDFYLKTIHLSNQSKSIDPPAKGKLISKIHYDQLVKKKWDEQEKQLEETKQQYEASHR